MARLKILTGEEGFEEFADVLNMSEQERGDRKQVLNDSFMPFKVTRFYTDLIDSQDEPYRTQMTNIVVPPVSVKHFVGRFDPYGNKKYRQNKRAFLQHKYPKTLLLHMDDFCISNCQFCYKVNEIIHESVEATGMMEKIDIAVEYLSQHGEIDNVLFTGGDPASFRRTKDITRLIGKLIEQDGIRVVRFATKGLAYDPDRFRDEELLEFFQEVNNRPQKQVSVIAQINHPGEMGENSREALRELRNAGVQIRGQPAIIKGVNDSVEILTDLQRKYLDNQIVSYYLTVFMPVRGVEQYGIPLHEVYKNVAESKRQLSGLEKKGILLASHDFGKLEICGFNPAPENPREIILKWHQATMSKYLPDSLMKRVPTRPEDIMILDYKPDMFCIDHVFEGNDLPFTNSEGELVEKKDLAIL